MPDIQVGKTKANDIKLSIDMYKEAQRNKLNLSQYLENLDPSEDYGSGEKLDALGRQLKRFGIRVAPGKNGVYAGDVESFYLTEESKVLFPEVISRVAREAPMATSKLAQIVAINTPIDGNVYLPYYVDDQPAEQTRKRVTEATQLPICEIKGQENTVKLYKYGRAIKASYEAIRRMKIDMLSLHVRRIAAQAGLDKADEALNVVINGDGNTNPATVYKLHTDLGGVVADGLDYKSWLKFLMKFSSKQYNCNIVIGGLDEIVELLTMQKPNVDPLALLSAVMQGPVDAKMEIESGLIVNYKALYIPSAPANKLVGIDNRYAIEQINEIGSDITEAEKFIMNQTSVLTVSENNAFAKLFNDATAVLDLTQ